MEELLVDLIQNTEADDKRPHKATNDNGLSCIFLHRRGQKMSAKANRQRKQDQTAPPRVTGGQTRLVPAGRQIKIMR